MISLFLTFDSLTDKKVFFMRNILILDLNDVISEDLLTPEISRLDYHIDTPEKQPLNKWNINGKINSRRFNAIFRMNFGVSYRYSGIYILYTNNI